jgi:hypothetical protein
VGGMKNHPFIQGDLYRLLKTSGLMRLRDIVRETGFAYGTVSSVLQVMRDKGCVIKHGTTHKCFWEHVPGHPPKDMRGKMEGSEIGREKAILRWRDNLAKAAAARGRNPESYICKPVPACALEECWQVPHVLRHWEKKVA